MNVNDEVMLFRLVMTWTGAPLAYFHCDVRVNRKKILNVLRCVANTLADYDIQLWMMPVATALDTLIILSFSLVGRRIPK